MKKKKKNLMIRTVTKDEAVPVLRAVRFYTRPNAIHFVNT